MILNEEQRKEFLEVSKPLMKWMSENCHPHCMALIESHRAELMESTCAEVTNEFIKG